jgi:adenosylcobinamide kinase/adenosylcobinamide-phosphate guanylyltransferase
VIHASVALLGSAAVPWPLPDCACRACLSALEPAAAAALQVGTLLVRGTTVRFTGAHPKDAAAGPEADQDAEADAADATDADADADEVTLAAGDAVERDGVRIVGLPAANDAAALVIVGRRVGPLLWVPSPGPLPTLTLEALADAGITVAALAAGTDGGPLAHSLARLRRAGALADGCDVVAIGLDHEASRDRLAVALPGWGARLAPDGALLGPEYAAPATTPPRRTLVLGPAASGKSAVAEALLAAEPDVDYLPTGPAPGPDDADWAARVDVHRARRPSWWQVLEGAPPARALATAGPPLLLDSVGTWVSAALDRCGAWDDAPGWQLAFDAEVDAVVGGWRQARRRVVAVGEETGWGVVPATPAGRRFRDALGAVNRRLAAEAEQVLLVVAGRVTELTEGAVRA